MREIGEILRRQREQRGVSLREAQAATKIRLKYLEALEAGDEAAFPGEVYMKGFLRSYADYLGLDGWGLVGQYRAHREAQERAREDEARAAAQARRHRRPAAAGGGTGAATDSAGAAAAPAKPPQSPRPAPQAPAAPPRARARPGRRRPPAQPWNSRVILLILIAIIVVALGALVTVRALLLPASEPATPGSPPASSNSGGPSPPPASPPGGPSSPGGTTTPAGPASPGPPAVALVTGTPEAAEYSVASAPLVLEAVAQERCWVRVEVDGLVAAQETLLPGERRTFEASQTLWLRAGNPGGLELVANGARLGPAGEDGVPRNLVFVVKSGG